MRFALAGTVAIGVTAWVAAVASPSPAATPHLGIGYDIDSPPVAAHQNQLDLYTPDGARPTGSRPVVVYVHGGGWAIGDKANQIDDKVELFTGAGYVFASVNYRLSPATGDPGNPDPERIRFPDHPRDVGEAIGWLDRHVGVYGGDPRRILLIGHSAGAHLVSLISTDPHYVKAYGVKPWQLIGTTALDTDAYDIPGRIPELGPSGLATFYNAFGTPQENAATNAWAEASPITWASARDPEFLLVTQAANPVRTASAERMAVALGQDPAGSVFRAPYPHRGINTAVGDPADASGETSAIVGFFARMVTAARPARTKLKRRPPSTVRIRGRRTRVRFAFYSKPSGSSFQCRLDGARFKRCRSPRSLRVRRGKHRFRVRAVSVRGRPGPAELSRFEVVMRRGRDAERRPLRPTRPPR